MSKFLVLSWKYKSVDNLGTVPQLRIYFFRFGFGKVVHVFHKVIKTDTSWFLCQADGLIAGDLKQLLDFDHDRSKIIWICT